MNEHDLKHIIEATLLAAGRPVTTQQLLDLFDERERPTLEQAQAALALLTADYAPRGVELVEVASGWRIQVRSRVAEFVSRLWQERPSRYSRALLETLALVAYRQPITRSEIEEIRGVSISSTIMRTLQERNWIRIVGHREVPGRPELLGTTREFLDYFGLRSLDQLPTLAELKDVETMGVQLELSAGEGSSDPAEAEPAGAADDVLVAAADGDVGANAEVEVDTDADAEEDDDDSSEEGADEALDAQRASDDPSLSADDAGVESEARAPLVASDELYDEQRSLVEPPPDSQT